MKLRGLFLFLIFIGVGFFAQADVYRRNVSFEWDAIEGATYYDVELKLQKPEGQEQKTYSFKAKEAVWKGFLPPAKYMMRLRAHDYRGVPGDWSPASDFNVELETTKIKNPATNTKVAGNSAKEITLPFSWEPVGGALSYLFEVKAEDGSFSRKEEIKDTQIKVTLPVAKNYTWSVKAVNSQNVESEAPTISQFSVIGQTLKAPQVEKPESKFVRDLQWKKIEYAEAYEVYLFKLNTQTRKWEKFQTYENYKEERLPFANNWSGGRYQIALRAKGNLRATSPLTKSTFEVVNGDRSPASEYTALVKTSIDRVIGWYGIASYLVTQIQYQGRNPEHNSALTYNALGGTGRVGAGWFSNVTHWGFLGIVDMSGFTVNGQTNEFAAMEANAVYRQDAGMRGELRYQLGLYYKELPETIGDPFTHQSTSSKISALGPHLGLEYWYSLTPKLGVMANIHLFPSLFKVSTPNGQALTPTLSTQLGFLGSYRFTPTFTGLAGYARREDKLSYKANPSSFSTGSDNNTADISGDYVNFFAEWSF